MAQANRTPATNVARPAQFDRATQHRRAMLAKIQIARKDLAMEEDDYRQIVFDQTGRTSLKEASDRDLHNVLEVMKAKGFKPLAKSRAAQHPVAGKARALWISLYHLNVVHNPSEQAFETFACKMLKCEKLVWAKQSDGYLLIEALKAMGTRNGWVQHDRANQKPLDPKGLQITLCAAILTKLKAGAHVPADWALHDAAWKLCGIANAQQAPWSAEDYGLLAKALGNQLRNLGGANG